MGCNRFKPDTPQTICWSCQNACGGCSWSRYKSWQPVEGWEAIETTISLSNHLPRMQSYIVLSCPQYVPDKR